MLSSSHKLIEFLPKRRYDLGVHCGLEFCWNMIVLVDSPERVREEGTSKLANKEFLEFGIEILGKTLQKLTETQIVGASASYNRQSVSMWGW